mmetsp:Transcript_37530/g.120640  ORF Transcript_37530/g.120640 Transcript_37530/m.120640 type:complete len:212 (-) Transcript_37530:69-704(-)
MTLGSAAPSSGSSPRPWCRPPSWPGRPPAPASSSFSMATPRSTPSTCSNPDAPPRTQPRSTHTRVTGSAPQGGRSASALRSARAAVPAAARWPATSASPAEGATSHCTCCKTRSPSRSPTKPSACTSYSRRSEPSTQNRLRTAPVRGARAPLAHAHESRRRTTGRVPLALAADFGRLRWSPLPFTAQLPCPCVYSGRFPVFFKFQEQAVGL